MKTWGFATDGVGMPAAFSFEAWLFLGALIVLGPLCVLYTLAVHQTNNQSVHDLKLRVTELRSEYVKRVREAKEASNAMVAEVDGELHVEVIESGRDQSKAA